MERFGHQLLTTYLSSQLTKNGTHPMLYSIERKPDWNVFRNMAPQL